MVMVFMSAEHANDCLVLARVLRRSIPEVPEVRPSLLLSGGDCVPCYGLTASQLHELLRASTAASRMHLSWLR